MRLSRSALVALLLVVSGCGSSSPSGADSDEPPALTLYTSVTQNTVDAVVAGFKAEHPGATVDVFRATTGALNARIAADERAGGLKADVIWGTDPLSMQSHTDQKRLRTWPLSAVPDVPDQYKTEYFWGTRLLHLVIVSRKGLSPAPTSWADLTKPEYKGAVALPDPAAAGSAFAALGYFSQTPGFGIEFYEDLKANGAVQVSAPAEVVTSVAQGRHKLGLTLDFEARRAAAQGSPIELVWPTDGAIAVYSPIAVTAKAKEASSAEEFIRYVLSKEGQAKIGASGWQPVVPGVEGPPMPADATVVYPDWTALFGSQKELLQQYQSIFGG